MAGQRPGIMCAKKKIVSKEVVSGQLSQILFIPVGESSVVFKASYSHFDLFQ